MWLVRLLAYLQLVCLSRLKGIADAKRGLVVHLHLRGVAVLFVMDWGQRDLVLAHA